VLRPVALVFALALVAAGPAHAELVASGVQDGMLAVDSKGTPRVAYVQGTRLVISTRSANRWRPTNAGAVSAGARVKAFRVGTKGPVALVQSANDRTLLLIRRRGARWQTIRLASVSDRFALGWPGLVLSGGLPIVAHTRIDIPSLNTQLLLLRIDARGRVRTTRITADGFPQSLVAPPAAPVVVGERVHVVESYGNRGVLGTIEWRPTGKTWTGLFIDAALGEFPIGPVLARHRTGTLYAAWTQSMLGFGSVPVTLAVRRRDPVADFVLDQAFTTALALPASGPEVAANEWASVTDLDLEDIEDLDPAGRIWAGTVVRGMSQVQVDGRIAGYAEAPRGARDLLLARPGGLVWFRSPRALSAQMRMRVRLQDNESTVSLTGSIEGVGSGRVTLYRERAGVTREAVGETTLSGGEFSFADSPPVRPLHYRAVYTDPATGIPYGALVRDPLSFPPPPDEDDEGDEGDGEQNGDGDELPRFEHSALDRLVRADGS
jgi:hypothetical protein